MIYTCFFDIETAGVTSTLSELGNLNPDLAVAFRKKLAMMKWPEDEEAGWIKFSPLHAEYGRVVAVCGNKLYDDEYFRLYDSDEKKILLKTFEILAMHDVISGWNVKKFDIPFLVRRARILGISPGLIHTVLSREIIDAKERWIGDTNLGCTLEECALALGLESPKNGEVSGATMHSYYHDETIANKLKLKAITKYCLSDAITVLNIVKRVGL